MSDNINIQKKEIIAREIDRLKKNNRQIKKMAPYSTILILVMSFARSFFYDNDFFFMPENIDYIGESLITFLFFISFTAIIILIIIYRNKKRIDHFKDEALYL